MNKQKATATNQTDSTQKAEQTSSVSKDVTVRRQSNIKLMQNVLLIWLDKKIDKNNVDCCNTITQLQSIVNSINTFTDDNKCVEFLKANNNEKAYLIISGSLGEHIVPHIQDMSQVDSIFIFCGDKNYHEKWAKNYSKIKGIFTESSSVCAAIKEAAQQCNHNLIPFSFMASNDFATTTNLNQLNPTCMYTQIFREILLSIRFEESHIKDFIKYCREQFASNKAHLKTVDQLEQQYRNTGAIWWYTCESFMYPTLNRALRLLDVDIIIRMGFFIDDLHRQIETLHNEQYGDQHDCAPFTVYRGQGMSTVDFDKLMHTKGGLISFNNFLSTSTKRNISLTYARPASADSKSVGILFVMTINPSLSTTPFASIAKVGFFKGEEAEILFSMHSIFRIRDTQRLVANYLLFQVDLELTNDNDTDLHELTDRIREETKGSTGWDRLGSLLLKIGQPKKAQEVYDVLLDQTTCEKEKGRIYNQLGWTKAAQREYEEAIKFYKQSIEINKKTLPSNHPDLAKSYNGIGLVYSKMRDYSKALSYYEKALEIRQQSLPSNDPKLGQSYNNMGNVYHDMAEYSKALSFHEKAVKIRQQSLPSNHPDLASSYHNIGTLHAEIGDSRMLFFILKNHLKFYNNHFLRIISISLRPTTTSVWYILTRVNTRKHFRLMKKPLKFDNNHFLRIMLTWLSLTATSV